MRRQLSSGSRARGSASNVGRFRARAGYTLLEVMIAVSVLMMGTTAFTMLHGTASMSTESAMAASLGAQWEQTWLERLRRDATLWTGPSVAGLAPTAYLRSRQQGWFVPANAVDANGELISAAADFTGRDVSVDSADARFCANVRVLDAHLYPDATSYDMLRVDVRVWWLRRLPNGSGRALQNANGGVACRTATDAQLQNGLLVSKLVTSTLVRWQ